MAGGDATGVLCVLGEVGGKSKKDYEADGDGHMRYARRKDTNHNEILDMLRQVGAVVKETYQFPGMLDAIVAFRGRIFWADVKHKKAVLTPAEQALFEDFARVGVTLYVWRTPDEALRAIGAI